MNVFIEHPISYKKSVRLEEIFSSDSEELYKACEKFCNFLTQCNTLVFKSCCPSFVDFLSKHPSSSENEYNIFRKKWYDSHTLEMTREAREKLRVIKKQEQLLNDVKTIGKKHQVSLEWIPDKEHWMVIRENGEDIGFFYL